MNTNNEKTICLHKFEYITYLQNILYSSTNYNIIDLKREFDLLVCNNYL